MLDIQIAQALAGDRLELIILPTEKCNFRCTYCYEDFAIGRMKPSVVQGIKNLILHRLPTLKVIQLGWFGGEPLLAYELILDICEFTNRHSRSSGVLFESDITTNAWALSEERFGRLVDCRVKKYQVTLDGPEHIHDKTRRMSDGRPTFARIYDNLKMMRSSRFDFHVDIRLHLTPSNFNLVKDFVRCLARDFGSDKRFELLPHTIRDLGGDRVDRTDIFDDEVFEQREREIFLFYTKLSGRTVAPPEALHVCYAAKANSFLIRPNGQIGKCTVDLYSERNTIGHLNEDGTMQIDDLRFSSWVLGLSTGDPKQLACPLSSVRF